jgi:hypothetical protein
MAGLTLGATPVKAHKRHHAGAVAKSATASKTSKLAGTTAGRTTKAAAHKKGKAVAARHPSRSYQQAPSPERYQEIQQALASKGFFQGASNGSWGADSVDALKRFQTSQNLTPDGKISSLSLIALGLGPKRLTAKSDSTPAQPGTPAITPSAPPQ